MKESVTMIRGSRATRQMEPTVLVLASGRKVVQVFLSK